MDVTTYATGLIQDTPLTCEQTDLLVAELLQTLIDSRVLNIADNCITDGRHSFYVSIVARAPKAAPLELS